jgi:hypothetical protein
MAHTKDEALLISVAESIGSTLGSIAAKADAAKSAIVATGNELTRSAERSVKKADRKAKSLVKTVKKGRRSSAKVKTAVKRSKVARTARKGVRRAKTAGKQIRRKARVALRSAKRRSPSRRRK